MTSPHPERRCRNCRNLFVPPALFFTTWATCQHYDWQIADRLWKQNGIPDACTAHSPGQPSFGWIDTAKCPCSALPEETPPSFRITGRRPR